MTAQAHSDKRLTPARFIAFAVIAIVAAGLGALHLSAGTSTVKVPHYAKAGQLTLHSCTYKTEAGSQAADCGTLVVPENRTDPRSRLIAVPVTRIRAHTAHPGAPVFYLQGGPGITNTAFPMASRFTPTHDVVLVGYRGVDSSTKLDCPEVVSAMTGNSDLMSTKTMNAKAAAYKSCANRLTRDGVDLRGYNSVERVDDFEAARQALHYGPINLISESAGTRTAMIYAWRYPSSINRSVMLGVNPPGHYLYDGATTDKQIQHYAELCAADASCTKRSADLVATMRSVSNDLPKRWGPFAIQPGNVRLATFFSLMHATSEANPLTAPAAIHAWQSAAAGNNSGLWLESLFSKLFIPSAQVWGDVAAIAQLDDDAASTYYANGGDHGTILRNAFTDHLWIGGHMVNAWPHSSEVDQYRTLRATDVPTLLISGDVDFATPAEFATAMLPSLHNGQQVVLHNYGHTTDTWNYDKAGNTKLINTYLDSGQVDRGAMKARTMSFQQSPTHERLAYIIISALAGLAVVCLLAVALLPLRQRRRGFVGGKTAAFARSVVAPVAALGGWATAVLLLLTFAPSVPIAGSPIVIATMAAPAAVVVYSAWSRRGYAASVRRAGMGVIALGAALGALLGLQAAPGFMGAITAAVGAGLGANLAVLIRDVVSGTRTETVEEAAEEVTTEPVPAL